MQAEQRKNYALTMFNEHPELFPEAHREPILKGRILLGMTPFEAKLAGGAFAFKVVADQARWPVNSDPYKVMWAQSMLADASEIWMTFKNSTQFDNVADQVFRVYFQNGKATQIENINT